CNVVTVVTAAGKVLSILKDAVILCKLDALAEELHDVRILLHRIPIEPADLIVLTICVVVSLLGSAEFVTAEHHRGTKREKQSTGVVFDELLSKLDDRGVVRFTFDATVPRIVIIRAVLVVLEVGIIVFAVIRDQVVESKPIVTVDKIDAVVSGASIVRVQIS